MCRFEHDLYNQGVVSTSLHVDPLVVKSHAQVEAHKPAGEESGWGARGDWEQVDLTPCMGYLAQVYFLQDRAVVAKVSVR
jgi:hypothetical protein